MGNLLAMPSGPEVAVSGGSLARRPGEAGEMAGAEGARESCWALGGVRPLEPTVESLCPACGCPTPSSASGTADLRPHSEHLSLSGDQRPSTSGCPGRCRALLLPLPLYSGNAAVGCRRLQAKPGPLETRGTPKMSRKNGTVKAASASPGFTFFCICCNVLDEPALFCSQQETVNVIFKN